MRIKTLRDHHTQVSINWDSGRSLMLILPKDRHRELAASTAST